MECAMSHDFEKKIIESLREQCVKLDERDELLFCLHRLRTMTTGRIDIMFCNGFIDESAQLLINSIFLYEDGKFDCAFYSVRQASEIINNMLYLANKGLEELEKWDSKGNFPPNKTIIDQLAKLDANYSEIKTVLADFFEEHEKLIKTSNKIIHKQGFDTFYAFRSSRLNFKKFDKAEETRFFLKLLKSCIGKVIVLFIVVEPLCLVLADEELSARFNFDPMTEAVDVEFFQTYLSSEIIEKIKKTSFFKEYSSWFAANEKMLPSVFDVVRNQFFDIESLDEIETQKHLLGPHDHIILQILQAGVKLSNIYPDACMFLGYFTSISSNYHATSWEYNKDDLERKEIFNEAYHNIFRSIVKVLETNWILEHNEVLSDEDVLIIKRIASKYGDMGNLIGEFAEL
jgi:hypothetical protein